LFIGPKVCIEIFFFLSPSLYGVCLQVRHFPLDELELASLRGTIQRVRHIGLFNCIFSYHPFSLLSPITHI